MPVTTGFDERLGIVIQRIEGDLKLADVLDAQQRLYLDATHDPSIPVLWDARTGRVSSLPHNEMRDMVSGSEALWDRMESGRTAIVTGSEADFGMGRMYEQLAEGMPRELRVFRDWDEAVAWLTELADADKGSDES